MSRLSVFSSPLLLGFDELERMLDRASKTSGDGYPPYNIERLPRTEGEAERLRITLAVAGFGRDELDVTIEENQLVIRGRQKEDDGRQAELQQTEQAHGISPDACAERRRIRAPARRFRILNSAAVFPGNRRSRQYAGWHDG